MLRRTHTTAIDCSGRSADAAEVSAKTPQALHVTCRACGPLQRERRAGCAPHARLDGLFLRFGLLGTPTLAADPRHMIAIAAHGLAALAASFACLIAGEFVCVPAGMCCLAAAARQHAALFRIQCGKTAPATSTALSVFHCASSRCVDHATGRRGNATIVPSRTAMRDGAKRHNAGKNSCARCANLALLPRAAGGSAFYPSVALPMRPYRRTDCAAVAAPPGMQHGSDRSLSCPVHCCPMRHQSEPGAASDAATCCALLTAGRPCSV